jgi:membrane protein DedA with SNARE-associated domain
VVAFSLVHSIVDWFGPVYQGALGYLVVAGVILLDRGAFTGVVIPGDLFLALGGIYAGRGKLAVGAVIAVGALAGVAGETISYWLGRRYGVRIIRHLPLANRMERHLDSARDYFKRHGGKTIFVGRYVSVAGTFMPFAAGMSKMPFRRFIAFDVAAIVLWATAESLLGYYLNSQIDLVDQILSRFGWALLATVALLFAGRFAWKRRDTIGNVFKKEKKKTHRTQSRASGIARKEAA